MPEYDEQGTIIAQPAGEQEGLTGGITPEAESAPSPPEAVSAPPEPSPTVEAVSTVGQVLSVGRTSGDRYVVRSELPEGGYKQSLMTAEEIRAAGGIVPVGGEQYIQRYAGVPLYGEEDKKLSTAYQFASDLVTEQGISEAEARRITELAMREPDAPELQTIPVEVKQRIVSEIAPKGYQLLEGAGITPQIVSTEAVKKLTRLTPGTEEYYDALQSLRLVSKEARYIPPEMIEKAQIAEIKDFRRENMQLASGEWVSIEEWNRAFSTMPEETASRYQKIALDPKRGLAVMGRIMEQDIKDFESKHLQLADGKWVSIDQWNDLFRGMAEEQAAKYQRIATTEGYDAMARAIKAEQERIDQIMIGLGEFRIKEPTAIAEYPEGGAPFEYYEALEQYDLAAALRKGMSVKDLSELFPLIAIKAAQDFNDQIAKAAKTEEIYRQKLWRNLRTGEIISETQLQAIVAERPAAKDEYIRARPALVLPADPKWQELKGRPKDDPERVAYLRRWQDAVIDAATLVSVAAMPFTMGAIGAVGKALTIPKVSTWAFQLPRLLGGISVKPIAWTATVVNPFVRSAVVIAKLANLYPAVLAASRVTDEIRTAQLQTDWQAFDKLSPAEKNRWAKEAGYGEDYDQLTNNEKAVVLLAYSVPPDITREKWLGEMGDKINDLTFATSQKAGWLQAHSPAPISIPLTYMGGVMAAVPEGIGYIASIPMLAANLVATVPMGTAPAFAVQTIRGMAEFFTKELPRAFAVNPYLAAGRVTGLFLLSPAAALKLAKGLGARASLRYTPERAMAMEYSTVRIRFDQVGEFLKLSPAERMRITEPAITKLLKGEKSVTIKGLRASIEIQNVPYQQVVGNTLWHFTPDIRPFNKGQVPVKGRLFTSPQAAMRFGVATSVGKSGRHSGLIEIRVPDSYQAKMVKLLSKGEAELESVFGKDTILDPIPGWTGKGISTNVYTGAYPIRRFTVLGQATKVTKLTPAVLARIRFEAGKAALGDLIKGWAGRADALRESFKVDPRTTRLQASINKLRTEKPYAAIADNVKVQRSSVPHPDFKGELKTRTKVLTYNQRGDAVFLGLDRSAPSFELIGGSANPKEILLQSGKWHDFMKSGRPLNWGEAVRSQLLGESNMRMLKTEYIGTYLGKVNDNALHGARIYRGKAIGQPDIVAAWNRFQRRKFGYNTPELKAGVWLYKDGTVKGVAGLKTSATEAVRLFNELGANPATKDVLAYVAKVDGFKVDGVKVDTGNKWLLKTRDTGFADRAVANKPLTPKQIANINKAEITYLKQRRMDIAKGAEPAMLDYLTAEGELRTLAELLHGRRRATAIKPNEPLRQRMDTVLLEMIRKDTSPKAKTAQGLLAKGKTKEAIKAYEQTMTAKSRADLYNRLKKEAEEAVKTAQENIYEQYGEYLYRPELYSRQYTAWLQRYLTAALANRPLEVARIREYETPVQLARLMVEAREFDRPLLPSRVVPPRYEPSRIEPTLTIVRRITPADAERVEPVPTEPERVPPPREEPEPVTPLRVPPLEPRKPPPPPPPPRRRPDEPPPPPPPPTILQRLVSSSPTRQPIPQGSIAWAQGMRKGIRGLMVRQWYYIPPPFDQVKPISLSAPPVGAVKTDSASPYDTIQVIGRSRVVVPARADIDLGWADIYITNGREIRFKSGGEETDIGTRVESPTEGMALLESGDLISGTPVSTQGISRPTMSRKKPKRKAKREDEFSDLTSVRGIRL